jgi:hypothetical protein
MTWPEILRYAQFARLLGRPADADAALDELLEGMRAHESVGDPGVWHSELVLELMEAGRLDRSSEIVQRLSPSPWRDLCAAVSELRLLDAAELAAATGEQPLQAELRLRAAQALVAEGRHLEAADQLEKARAFWTRVAATAYLREAEEVLAEAS